MYGKDIPYYLLFNKWVRVSVEPFSQYHYYYYYCRLSLVFVVMHITYRAAALNDCLVSLSPLPDGDIFSVHYLHQNYYLIVKDSRFHLIKYRITMCINSKCSLKRLLIAFLIFVHLANTISVSGMLSTIYFHNLNLDCYQNVVPLEETDGGGNDLLERVIWPFGDLIMRSSSTGEASVRYAAIVENIFIWNSFRICSLLVSET